MVKGNGDERLLKWRTWRLDQYSPSSNYNQKPISVKPETVALSGG